MPLQPLRAIHLSRQIDLRRWLIGFIVLLAVTLLAMFVGLVASQGNLFLAAMVLGLIGGAILLAVPRLSVWLIIVLGLTAGFIISMAGPGSSKIAWGISLLGFLLVVPAFLKLLNPQPQGTPGFIWLALGFMMYSILATVVQWHSMAEFMAGFKRYFQVYGLMFALALLAFKPEDYRRWLKLFLVIAVLQLPFVLYEFFVLVPMRGGLGAGAESTDVVAGSLGANLEGGSANAEMATFLLITVAFLFSRWRVGLISKSRLITLGLLCLLPLGLGETKIVLVMLPMIGFVLMREELIRSPGRYLPQFAGMLLFTVALAFIYVGMHRGTGAEVLSETLRYNFHSQGYGLNYLNRTTVYSFWWAQQSWQDPLGFVIGHGLGSSYFASNNPVPGHVALQHIRYGISLTTASTLLWDTGLLGLLLFLSMLLSAWHAAVLLWKTTADPTVRADALAIQAAIALFALHVIYRNTLLNYLPFELLMASVLGYLGYLLRSKHSKIISPTPSRH